LCPKCLWAAGEPSGVRGRKSAKGETTPPPSVPELQARFPSLEVVGLVGQGGMGAVYEARQRGLGRRVALKLLWAPEDPEANFEERFQREGHALAQLSHENIVTVHDAGRAGEHYWLLMEFVDGVNLRDLLERGRVEPAQALSIVAQVCSALEYAHRQGVVHRDIKPENILIARDGRVKVVDFGLARLLTSDPGDTRLTQSFLHLGTEHYMAPEQRKTPRDVDHRADIYSLGVVLYELLTGEVPKGRFELPSRIVDIDSRLDGVVARALQTAPSKRYQAISDVQSAVEDIVRTRDLQRSARRSSVARASERSFPTVSVALAMAAALLVLWLVFEQRSGSNASGPSLDEQFADACAKVQRERTRADGIAMLEAIWGVEPDYPDLRPRLAAALNASSHDEVAKGSYIYAYVHARRANELAPGVTPSAELEQLESKASAALRDSVRNVSPGAGKPLSSTQKPIEFEVELDPRVRATLELKLQGQPLAPVDGPYKVALSGLVEGRNRVPLVLTGAGDFQLDSSLELVVDVTPPTLDVLAPNHRSVVKEPVELRGTAADKSGVRVVCKGRDLETVPDELEKWRLVLPPLGEGEQEVEVTAIDPAGHTKSQVRTFIVDNTAPAIHAEDGRLALAIRAEDGRLALATKLDSFPVKLQVTDSNLERVEAQGTRLTPDASGNFQLSARAGARDGETRVTVVTAHDRAGNSSSLSIEVRRDTTKPRINISTVPTSLFPGTRFQIVCEVQDDSDCELFVGGVAAPRDGKRFYSGTLLVPKDWDHEQSFPVDLRAQDSAGNELAEKTGREISEPCVHCNGAIKFRRLCSACLGSTRKMGKLACKKLDCWLNPSVQEGSTICSDCLLTLSDTEPACSVCTRQKATPGICQQCRGTGHTDADLVQKRLDESPIDFDSLVDEVLDLPGAGEFATISEQLLSVWRASDTPDASRNQTIRNGLEWLKWHQSEDGSWQAKEYQKACGKIGPTTCSDVGEEANDVGVTGLALLAFMAAGSTTNSGPYQENVGRGLKWLRGKQDSDTGLLGGRIGHAFIYNHAIASRALCEAYRLSQSPWLKTPAQRAIEFIQSARNPYGAWRYSQPPSGENDTSVTGWMVLALATAQNAGLKVDTESFRGALTWIDEATDTDTGRVGYDAVGTPSSRVTRINDHFNEQRGEAMTAVGLGCRFLLGQDPRTAPIMRKHADLLSAELPFWSADPRDKEGADFYYWYYGSFAMHKIGGEPWKRWSAALTEALVSSQRKDGDEKGSWDASVDPWEYAGGRIYTTALALLALQCEPRPKGSPPIGSVRTNAKARGSAQRGSGGSTSPTPRTNAETTAGELQAHSNPTSGAGSQLVALLGTELIYVRPEASGYWSRPSVISKRSTGLGSITKTDTGSLEVVALEGTQLTHYRSQDGISWHNRGPVTRRATGSGSIAFSSARTLEIVVLEGRTLVNYSSQPNGDWSRRCIVTAEADSTGSMISGSVRNLECVVLEGSNLVHYWRAPRGEWARASVVSTQATGPGVLMSGYKGNFELLVKEGSGWAKYWTAPGKTWNRIQGEIRTSRDGIPSYGFCPSRRFELYLPEDEGVFYYFGVPGQMWQPGGLVVSGSCSGVFSIPL
jgi:predicted Ser/Thr protein kinase